MRNLILRMACAVTGLAALAGMVAGTPAEASPVSTHPLAAGEVLLEVTALGTATTRAELAEFNLGLTSRGATEAEARRAHDALAARVTAAARRLGVAADDISIGEAAFDPAMADAREVVEPPVPETETEAAAPELAPQAELGGSALIRLRRIDRLDELRSALREAGVEYVPEPTYSAGDQSAARRQARAEALATARADAEAYAASLGLRVVRIVRVTERVGMDLSSLMMMGANSAMANMFGRQGVQAQGPEVPTFVMVGVDFALAPQ